MPRLNQFTFFIQSFNYISNGMSIPSTEDIQKTFIDFPNNNIISYVDFFPNFERSQCHIYSYPFLMRYYTGISNSFPGGLFEHVRAVSLYDERPFEHEFFLRIQKSFPFMKELSLVNRTAQNRKQSNQSNSHNQNSSLIKYTSLCKLSIVGVHDDYVEEFLLDAKTYFQNNLILLVNYECLERVTHDFSRDATRTNCGKISLFNGLFTLITFKSKILREVGCDYFLRIFIHMDQWLNAYVACERAITVVKGARFSKKKSKKVTKFIIILLLIFNIFIFIHEPLYRQLIDETDEDKNEKRIWCVVSYSSNLQIYNSVINTFQFFTPLIINFISAFILIAQKPRRQSITQRKRNFKDILKENYREHKHLFIAPAILVILALPRLIISFISKCIQSSDDSWLFPTAYFISLIPSNAYFYCICITIEIL
ncbi:unnamed protein product [Adineta steineri]|uniref:G-protein coupled receptors family 1 profile domain-containing protein n=1 Tax=Adineta steineri TaxID=433720 RepID=A0A814JJB2_9BILA|nr:unnamed protein product [Adineta steineri]